MQNQRKKFFVNNGIQGLVIGAMAFCALAGGLITFIVLQIFFYSFKKQGAEMGLSPDHLFFRFIDQQASTMNLVIVGIVILFMLAFSFLGLRLSHKIAGPIFRFEQYIKELNEGKKLEPLVLRDGDFFQPLVSAFNQLMQKRKQT